MTKAELATRLAGTTGLSRVQAERAINGFTGVISEAMARGEKITLVGFGTFSVGQRAQREGRNPRTGDKITIPASKIVKFKAGSKLRDVVK
jgi:DNA-binding protein HU-beta